MNGTRLPLSGIVPESVVDGSGIRFTLFVQGCPHRCAGCHNPLTHPLEGGRDFSVEEIFAMINSNPLLSGATFSGGEPFLYAGALAKLGELLHQNKMNVWCYTGYTLEELTEKAKTDKDIKSLLEQTDILVDGKFEESLRDLTLKFKGSSNQRIINLAQMRKTDSGKIILLD